MKKLIGIICCFLLTGCIASEYNPTYRSNCVEVVYKNDKNTNSGDISAVYNNRIYYFSQKEGISGIYSMEMTGDDAKLEVTCKDIQKMYIKKDILYYLDFAGIDYNDENPKERWGNKKYVLKSLNLLTGENIEHKEMDEALKQSYKKLDHSGGYKGIWDFSYLDDEKFLVSSLVPTVPTGQWMIYSQIIENGKPISWDGNDCKILGQGIISLNCILLKDGDNYFICNYRQLKERVLTSDTLATYSISDQNASYTADSVLWEIGMPIIFGVENNSILATLEDSIFKYDYQNGKVINSISFENAQSIRMLENGKYLLVVFADREEVYSFDKDSFEVKNVLVEDGCKIISIDQESYIRIDKNSLTKKSLPLKRDIWKKPLSDNYLVDEYKIEIAGDWLFVKYFDVQQEKAYLKDKICLNDNSMGKPN